jgi:hypothetical protein
MNQILLTKSSGAGSLSSYLFRSLPVFLQYSSNSRFFQLRLTAIVSSKPLWTLNIRVI